MQGVLVISILVTVFTTKEYTTEELESFTKDDDVIDDEKTSGLMDIFTDFRKMPLTMRQLSYVQFFSWFGLFGMWVFTTPAIAHHVYGLAIDDTSSKAYQDAGDWVGVLFGIYNSVSAVYAFFLPAIAHKFGRKKNTYRFPARWRCRINIHVFCSQRILVDWFDGGCGYRVGQHSCHALRYSCGFYSCAKNGSLYGYF